MIPKMPPRVRDYIIMSTVRKSRLAITRSLDLVILLGSDLTPKRELCILTLIIRILESPIRVKN